MKRTRAMSLPLVALLFVAACGVFGSDDADEPGPAPVTPTEDGGLVIEGSAADRTFEIESISKQWLLLDATTSIHVKIKRGRAIEGPTRLVLSLKHPGVTPTELTLPVGVVEGDLEVAVAPTSPQGELDAELVATAKDVTAKTSFKAHVRGNAGTIDTSFGIAGLSRGFTCTGTTRGEDVLVQPDGKLVVVARAEGPSCLVRLNPDGKPDIQFGTSGIASEYGVTNASTGVLLPDGSIVMTGGVADVKLQRFLPNGTKDTTFGTDSVVDPSLPAGSREPQYIARRPDGRFDLGFLRLSGGVTSFAHARLKADGALDGSGSYPGWMATVWRGDATFNNVSAVATRADGKVFGIGSFNAPAATQHGYGIFQIDALGAADATFGDASGQQLHVVAGALPLLYGATSSHAMIVDPQNGSVTGAFVTAAGTVLARFLANGSPDTSFGSSGVSAPIPENKEMPVGLYEQPDGKILVLLSSSRFARFDGSGVLDTTFGTSGVVGFGIVPTIVTAKMRRLDDQRVVLVGTAGSEICVALLWY